MKETNHGHWMFRDKPPFFKGVHIAGRVVLGIAAAAVFALVFGVLVMLLWNWLMPAIFGLGAITFWQAWGLVVLSHILFKSHAHSPHRPPNDKWKEHFKKRMHEHKSHSCCQGEEEKTDEQTDNQ